MSSDAHINISKLEQTTVQFAVNGMIWIDKHGKIRHANNAACEMLRYDYDELTSMTIFEIDPNVKSGNFEKNYLSTIREKGRHRFESQKITGEDKSIPVEVTVFYIQHGDVDLYCSFFFDISIRKQMMEKVVESEARMRAIFNNHFQLTGLLDIEGHLLMANKTALDLVGAEESTVLGAYFWETPWFAHSKKLQKKVKKDVERAVRGEIVWTEFSLIDRHGEELLFEHSYKPIRDAGGNIRFILKESRDITKTRRAENDLKKAYSELEKLKDRLQDENLYLKEELRESQEFSNLVGQSPAFKNVLYQIEQVAETNATVLILGETGTGKELVARTIHELSNRSERPLVKLNCAAIPPTLIESELFGHEKGAFTGAHTQKIGRFELAHKGTIFLDEIGELSIGLQAKLLRVLQENEYERVGGTQTLQADIRIIAATNRDLKSMIKAKQFREDLFYRLHVFPVYMPSLRERVEDIPLLSKFLIKKISDRIGKKITHISQKTMERLKRYHWPGNIRELENVLERAAVLSQGSRLEIGEWFQIHEDELPTEEWQTLDEIQRQYIIKVLKKTRRRVRGVHGAARILDVNPSTLESRIKKLDIDKYEI